MRDGANSPSLCPSLSSVTVRAKRRWPFGMCRRWPTLSADRAVARCRHSLSEVVRPSAVRKGRRTDLWVEGRKGGLKEERDTKRTGFPRGSFDLGHGPPSLDQRVSNPESFDLRD